MTKGMADKLNRNSKLIIGINLLSEVLYLFLNTFLVAYLFTLTNYDTKIISIYYMISAIAVVICFIGFGSIVKTGNKLVIFRISMVLTCLNVLMIVLLKENVRIYYVYLGIFYGISLGMYWLVSHTLSNKAVGGNRTKTFVSIGMSLAAIVSVAFPIIFGASIELTSFATVGVYVLILVLAQLSLSLFLKDEKEANSAKFSLREYLRYIKDNKQVKNFYKIALCNGVVIDFFRTLTTLMIVMTFKTALNLGFLTTIFAFCSVLAIYMFHKFYNGHDAAGQALHLALSARNPRQAAGHHTHVRRRKNALASKHFCFWNKNRKPRKIFIFCGIMLIISIIFLAIDITRISVILFSFSFAVFMIILQNRAYTLRYNCLEENLLDKYIVEHHVMTDIYLGSSRLVGYFMLFLVSFSNNIIYFKLLFVLIVVYIIIYVRNLLKF